MVYIFTQEKTAWIRKMLLSDSFVCLRAYGYRKRLSKLD